MKMCANVDIHMNQIHQSIAHTNKKTNILPTHTHTHRPLFHMVFEGDQHPEHCWKYQPEAMLWNGTLCIHDTVACYKFLLEQIVKNDRSKKMRQGAEEKPLGEKDRNHIYFICMNSCTIVSGILTMSDSLESTP